MVSCPDRASSARGRCGRRGKVMTVRRTAPLVVPAIVLSLSGAYVSRVLLNKHVNPSASPSWVQAVCEPGEVGRVSCDEVLASRWAWIPPKKDSDPEDTVRYPVAGLGMAYFVILLVWYVLVGRCGHERRRWHLLPLGMNSFGLVGSVGFTVLMAFDLDVWCPLCVVTHVINALLFVVNILLWPLPVGGRPAEPDSAADGRAEDVAAGRHPSFRLAVAAVALGVMIVGAMNQNNQIKRLAYQRARLLEIVKQVQGSAESLVAMHQNAKAHEITLRPDEAVRHGRPGGPLTVIWSDFECNHCGKFAKELEEQYREHFGGLLRIVFKHYPLTPECNRYVQRPVHPHSCKGARLAEAARIQGGSKKFWQAHDLLFERQESLGTMDPREFAADLGLDPERLVADMHSDTVDQRIAEDVEQGRSVGVKATPTVFIDGREVSGLARRVPAFWKLLGNLTRSEWGRQQRAGTSVTPGSPGPPGAR